MMTDLSLDASGYKYVAHSCGHHHAYLVPAVHKIISSTRAKRMTLFDLGCGNGSVAAHFADAGFEVVGVDPSTDGIAQGRKAYPHLALHEGSAYDDLASQYGTFPFVISLEVVEHVYSPRQYASTLFDLVEPGGIAIISTPYHGYLKNLALAIAGRWDSHLNPLWDHGHIKFWSIEALRCLLEETGFESVQFERVGRIPALAKSMIAIASKRS